MALYGHVFNKLTSNAVTGKKIQPYSLSLLLIGATACLFFAFSSGFYLPLNPPTFLFSIVFAFVCVLSIISSLLMYKLTSITGVSTIVNALAIVGNSILGVFVFGEKLLTADCLKIIIVISAMTLLFINASKNQRSDREETQKKTSVILLIAVCLLNLIATCASTLVMKFYTEATSVYSNDSFFFYTNVVMIALSGLIFFITTISSPQSLSESLEVIKPKSLFTIIFKTAGDNISTLIAMPLITMVNLSVYSSLSSALGIIASVIASLIFKEKLKPLTCVSVALSIVAVVI